MEEQGWRYHLSDLFAAIGREQLKKLISSKVKKEDSRFLYIQLQKLIGIKLLKINYDKTINIFSPLRILNDKRDKLKIFLKKINSNRHSLPA